MLSTGVGLMLRGSIAALRPLSGLQGLPGASAGALCSGACSSSSSAGCCSFGSTRPGGCSCRSPAFSTLSPRGGLPAAPSSSAAFSTSAAARAAVTAAPSASTPSPPTAAGQAAAVAVAGGRQLFKPSGDIPPEARAKLADELEAEEAASSGRAPRGRRVLSPQRASANQAAEATGGLAPSTSSPAAIAAASRGVTTSDWDEAEVRFVFDKLIGGLTKSGKKGTARKIVSDALRVMQAQLKKGSLEEVK
ncbi:hypothetical protein HYH03_010434 [Edaphochlamys debaryana]|uniref:Uncharacterized protein n=1 Tax=Edaphochlamys debaryana TaxID=47281 RepID=A0A835XZD8_9CHLO|nr:hypothetical protein HYH03_010434 [Edaphochlamys debaryana]|eukprot:KAG2491226.1 hypothetical protein HYH03_010434 [Edaphochlamys debaryana]